MVRDDSPIRATIAFISVLILMVMGLSPPARAGDPEPAPVRRFVAVPVGTVSPDVLFDAGADIFGRTATQYHVLVPPDAYDALTRRGVKMTVLVDDADAAYRRYRAGLKRPLDESFADYHDYDQTVEVIDRLAAEHPDLVALKTIGQSIEGRPIRAMRITEHARDVDPDKPAILVMGCHHAREWISVEVPLYFADYLTGQFRRDGDVTRLLRNTEIWIVPIVNPDGFVYSWTSDRWWRKNRREMQVVRTDRRTGEPIIDPETGRPIIDTVHGVDPNRNYDFEWGHDVGSSGNPRSQTFRGSEGFSEPETRAIRDLMTGPDGRTFLAALTYHNFSQLFLYPNGYTTAPVQNVMRYEQLAREMTDLINAAHTDPSHDYGYGQGSVILYPTSGDFTDWAEHVTGTLSYTVELRPAGPPYFELPPNEIIPTCRENLPAFFHLAHEVLIPDARSADADHDGFLDDEDYCPNSPTTVVDEMGCDESEVDLDHDGVLNVDDACRDSPSGQTVDGTGCRVAVRLTVRITSNVERAPVSVDPADIDGLSRGETGTDGMTRDYASDETLILTAAHAFGPNRFLRWIIDGTPFKQGRERVAVSATADVAAEAVYSFPESLRIVGPTQVPDLDPAGMPSMVRYHTEVLYSDGAVEPIDPDGIDWLVAPPESGVVGRSGDLVVRGVDADAGYVDVDLTARGDFQGAALASEPTAIRVYDVDSYVPACAEVAIDGPARVASLGSARLSAAVVIEGNALTRPTDHVAWSMIPDGPTGDGAAVAEAPASISAIGEVTARWVPADTPVTVRATYQGDAGDPCTAERVVTVLAGDEKDRPPGRGLTALGNPCGAAGMLTLMTLFAGLCSLKLYRPSRRA